MLELERKTGIFQISEEFEFSEVIPESQIIGRELRFSILKVSSVCPVCPMKSS